jgi:hypothetical protein
LIVTVCAVLIGLPTFPIAGCNEPLRIESRVRGSQRFSHAIDHDIEPDDIRPLGVEARERFDCFRDQPKIFA